MMSIHVFTQVTTLSLSSSSMRQSVDYPTNCNANPNTLVKCMKPTRATGPSHDGKHSVRICSLCRSKQASHGSVVSYTSSANETSIVTTQTHKFKLSIMIIQDVMWTSNDTVQKELILYYNEYKERHRFDLYKVPHL